jgi:hypothetical protein
MVAPTTVVKVVDKEEVLSSVNSDVGVPAVAVK